MIINHNLGAMNALSALNANSNSLNAALEKLSTGKKVNSAADNASGYAISQKMQAQINGLNQATQNAQDGISLIQTASGALNETTSILQNMRQLAVQASNSTTTQADRSDLQTQFNQLASQINNIGNTTQFNTQNLLNGGVSSAGGAGSVTQATAASFEATSANTGFVHVSESGSFATSITSATSGTVEIKVAGHTFDIAASSLSASSATAVVSTLKSTTEVGGSDTLSQFLTVSNTGTTVNFTAISTSSNNTFTIDTTGATTDTADVNKLFGLTGNTGASKTFDTATQALSSAVSDATGASIQVNGQTFDISKALEGLSAGSSMTDVVNALNNVTSGQTKLSDVATLSNDNGNLKIVDNSTGSSSTIVVNAGTGGSNTTVAKLFSMDSTTDLGKIATQNGQPSTIQQAGLEAGTALGASSDTSINAGDTLNFTIGNGGPVSVALNTGTSTKTYATNSGNATSNQAAMQNVINDLNSSLQTAGLGGQVTAALSSDNKVQFISNSGVDIKVSDGTGAGLEALGFSSNSDSNMQNVQQVVGPGVQGSGFNATFQIGANSGQTMNLTIGDMRAQALGVTGNAGEHGFSSSNNVTDGTNNVKSQAALDITSTSNADSSIKVIDSAIQKVTTEQANLGAVQNRLQSTINNLGTSQQNLTTAESGITDVNMASEMSKFTQDNVLQQAAVSMLAQANQQPQLVLKLLG